MKKTCYSLLLCGALVLTGCNNSMQNDTENPMQNETSSVTQASTQNETTTKHFSFSEKASDNSWGTILTSYIETTYDGIQKGLHREEYVLLSFTVKDVSYDDLTNTVICSGLFPSNDSSIQLNVKFICDELSGYSPKDIQPGDNIRACFYINGDGSFDSVSQGFSVIKDKNDSISENETPEESSNEEIASETTVQEETTVEIVEVTQEVTTSSPADFSFMGKVKNDVTGNWRWAKVSTDLEPSDYALYYYNTYFKSDDEIHAIINSYSNTTVRLRYLKGLNMLDVGILQHIENEELDAKILFSGDLIEQYQINIETGEKIQE